MRPEIHFDYLEPRQWEGKTFKQLHGEMNELRKKVKDATGYFWDNSHFYINDCFGRPALTVGFYETNIAFWNARNGASIGSFYERTGKEKLLAAVVGSDIFAVDAVFTEEMAKLIDEWTHKVSEGLTMCNECRGWFGEYRAYSYAGAVCNGCFDPKRHTMPDTMGDG